MSRKHSKSGPTCHCVSKGGSTRFISYTVSGPTPEPYHTCVVKSGDGQHLPLPQDSGNLVHVFGKDSFLSCWIRLWESTQEISYADELEVKYVNDRQGSWTVYWNGAIVKHGQFSYETTEEE